MFKYAATALCLNHDFLALQERKVLPAGATYRLLDGQCPDSHPHSRVAQVMTGSNRLELFFYFFKHRFYCQYLLASSASVI
jgi:hypothetical protein